MNHNVIHKLCTLNSMNSVVQDQDDVNSVVQDQDDVNNYTACISKCTQKILRNQHYALFPF